MNQLQSHKPLKSSLKEYARGIAGGLLFSFPLLYTMEVWWAGFTTTPRQLLLLMLVTYLLLLGYNRFAGMHPGSSWPSVLIESIEEMGIGLILAFGALLMLNRIQLFEMSVMEIMSKTVIEAMTVSIGVSIGTAQLGADEGEQEKASSKKKEKETDPNRSAGKLRLAVLALCGAVVIGGNVAPTEEVLMIAAEADPVHILAMALCSLILSVIVVYFSDFKGTGAHSRNGFLFAFTFDTCVSYLMALAASAFMLWFFGRFDGESVWNCFAQTIVLGVLASLGASAGRLLIK